jgi:hypothetical protein
MSQQQLDTIIQMLRARSIAQAPTIDSTTFAPANR